MDPEWVRALDESTQKLEVADAATAAALARGERRALARLRKMAPSHMRTVLLSRSSSHDRGEPHSLFLAGYISSVRHCGDKASLNDPAVDPLHAWIFLQVLYPVRLRRSQHQRCLSAMKSA